MNDELQSSLKALLDVIAKRADKDERPREKDSWDRAKVVAQWVAAIAVPVTLGLVGHWVTLTLKSAETSTRMVELAVDILTGEPTATDEDRQIRRWSLDVIEKYSGVTIPETAKEGFETSPFPLPQHFGGIVGVDDRVEVADTTVAPWSSVCHIGGEDLSDFSRWGTGVLVHPRVLLSAAGRISDGTPDITVAPGVQVRCGRKGTSAPFGMVEPLSLHRKAVEGESFSLVFYVLPAAGREVAPSFEFDDSPSASAELAEQLHFAGYPADHQGRMIRSSGRVLATEGSLLYHDLDTGGGSGGGPLWIIREDRRILVAVHIAAGGQGSRGKVGILVTKNVIDAALAEILEGA